MAIPRRHGFLLLVALAVLMLVLVLVAQSVVVAVVHCQDSASQ
jgi:hypothetical protein